MSKQEIEKLRSDFNSLRDLFDTFQQNLDKVIMPALAEIPSISKTVTQHSAEISGFANLEKLLGQRMDSLEEQQLARQTDITSSTAKLTTDIKHVFSTIDKFMSDVKYERRQAETAIAQFREDTDPFRLSQHPSLSSVLFDLNSTITTFLNTQEALHNTPLKLTDPSCPSFVKGYTYHIRYKHNNGHFSFYQVLQRSFSVFEIFLEKIRLSHPDFCFTDVTSDLRVFTDLLKFVFYPDGFNLEGFQLILSTYPMSSTFTIQSAYEYALFIRELLSALKPVLPPDASQISKFWTLVISLVDTATPNSMLRSLLSSVYPHSYTQFYKILDSKFSTWFESQKAPSDLLSSTSSLSNSLSSSLHPSQRFPGPPFQQRSSPVPYSGKSSLATPPPSSSINRSVAAVSFSRSSCENCGGTDHTMFNCPHEYCRQCQNATDCDFFHRPQNCSNFDSHEEI
jgi:hypothetical protein